MPADGTRTLRLVATDHAGNEASTEVTVRIDTTPPSTPLDLRATLEGRDARLDWNASPETDVVGYHLSRDGTRITNSPVSATTYLDANLAEGEYGYVVVAVDRAGNESDPSNEARVQVDTTPPDVRLVVPDVGARVSGVVDIEGTAYSDEDFHEYRLYLVRGGQGGPRELLRRSPAPVLLDLLAEWNTLGETEGAQIIIELEAEDTTGNVARTSVQVVVDNLAPARPTGLVAEVAAGSRTIAVTWDPNTESDLAGYLLYRDDQLVSAAGDIGSDLRPFAIEENQYPDLDRPDGTYVYVVYAIDEAGNLSPPSLPDDATVDLRAPQIEIVLPVDGEKFDVSLFVRAESADEDVERVLFEVRPAGSGAFAEIATVVAPPGGEPVPWETTWEPGSAFSFGTYEFRATATDFSGQIGPASSLVQAIYTDLTRPAGIQDLVALTDGDTVNLTWQAVTDSDLDGYIIERTLEGEAPVRLSADPVSQANYSDTAVPDGRYTYRVFAIDEFENEGDAAEDEALVYLPSLPQPPTPIWDLASEALAGSGAEERTYDVLVQVQRPSGTESLPSLVSTDAGAFTVPAPAVERGRNVVRVRLRDDQGNLSREARAVVVSRARPSEPTGVQSQASGLDVSVTWNASPEPNVVGYRLLRDGEITDPLVPIANLTAELVGRGFGAERAIDQDPGTQWSGFQPFDNTGLEVRFAQKRFLERIELDWQAFGVDANGVPFTTMPVAYDIQVWSQEVWAPILRLRDQTPATVELRDGEGVTLQLPFSYATDGVRVMLLQPNGSRTPRLREIRFLSGTLQTNTTATDTPGDGVWQYSVVAVDDLGFASDPGAADPLPVGDTEPPAPVVLSGNVVSSDALLQWTASTSSDVVAYELERDGQVLLQHVDLQDLTHRDERLANGTYEYVVRAVDTAREPECPVEHGHSGGRGDSSGGAHRAPGDRCHQSLGHAQLATPSRWSQPVLGLALSHSRRSVRAGRGDPSGSVCRPGREPRHDVLLGGAGAR